jgi:hypothetical protein
LIEILKTTVGNNVHNLLLVDFPCGKSLPAAGKLRRFQCWFFFYYFSLITSQQNHAQTRWQQAEK